MDAESGSWPAEAIADAMWRKEALGVLLWALEHLAEIPPYGEEFQQQAVDEAIMRYGSVTPSRERLRPDDETRAGLDGVRRMVRRDRGPRGEDATMASVAAERFRALSWLRDATQHQPDQPRDQGERAERIR